MKCPKCQTEIEPDESTWTDDKICQTFWEKFTGGKWWEMVAATDMLKTSRDGQ